MPAKSDTMIAMISGSIVLEEVRLANVLNQGGGTYLADINIRFHLELTNGYEDKGSYERLFVWFAANDEKETDEETFTNDLIKELIKEINTVYPIKENDMMKDVFLLKSKSVVKQVMSFIKEKKENKGKKYLYAVQFERAKYGNTGAETIRETVTVHIESEYEQYDDIMHGGGWDALWEMYPQWNCKYHQGNPAPNSIEYLNHSWSSAGEAKIYRMEGSKELGFNAKEVKRNGE